MARFPSLPDSELNQAQSDLMERIRRFSSASASGPFPMLLRSPILGDRFLSVSQYLRFETGLPEDLAELAILIHARVREDAYEWSMHTGRALAAGLSQDLIDDLWQGRKPRQMDARQAAVYRFCVQALRRQSVDEVVFGEVKAALGESVVVDLTVTLGFYSMLSLMLAVAEATAHGRELPPFPPMAEPLPWD
ncbi:MAG: carboxymuconolactone decarboxylase family protein [Pigmentiphaga sp.]